MMLEASSSTARTSQVQARKPGVSGREECGMPSHVVNRDEAGGERWSTVEGIGMGVLAKDDERDDDQEELLCCCSLCALWPVAACCFAGGSKSSCEHHDPSCAELLAEASSAKQSAGGSGSGAFGLMNEERGSLVAATGAPSLGSSGSEAAAAAALAPAAGAGEGARCSCHGRRRGHLNQLVWCRAGWWVDLLRRRWILASFMWCLLGAAVSFLVFWFSYMGYQKYRQEQVQVACRHYSNIIESNFRTSSREVELMSGMITMFYYKLGVLNQSSYYNLTADNHRLRPYTSTVTFAPFVPHNERISYEKEHGDCIAKALRFTPNMSFVCEDDAPLYAPILFIEPPNSTAAPVNAIRRNIMRVPPLIPSIQRIINGSTSAVFTSDEAIARTFFCNSAGLKYIVRMFPVYDKLSTEAASSAPKVKGILLFGFDLGRLVPDIISGKLSKFAAKEGVAVRILDRTNESDPAVLFKTEEEGNGGYQFDLWLNLEDSTRRYQVQCEYISPQPFPPVPIVRSVLVFLFMAFIAFLVWAVFQHLSGVESNFYRMESLKDNFKAAKVAAELASKAKGTFLVTMSHELRTPLNGVIGMMNLLLETPLDATQLDYVETARTSGRALVALINDILDLSKIEAGRMELESAPMSLRSEVDDVLSMFVEKIRSKPQLEVAAFVHESVPATVLGDSLRLRQVLMNLLSNACKFTYKGHIFICIRTASRDEKLQHPFMQEKDCDSMVQTSPGEEQYPVHTLSDEKAMASCNSWQHVARDADPAALELIREGSVRLVVSIEDTGEGIPFASQRTIFKPFVQADASTTRTHGGTGIGLSISRQLVQLMGGNLSLVSRPNVGTTFFFDIFLPCPASSFDPPEIQASLLPTLPSVADIINTGAWAMVVDNRDVRRAVLENYLMDLKFSIRPNSVQTMDDLRRILIPSRPERERDCNDSAVQRLESVILVDAEWLLENGGAAAIQLLVSQICSSLEEEEEESHEVHVPKPTSQEQQVMERGDIAVVNKEMDVSPCLILVAKESEVEALRNVVQDFDALLMKPVRHNSLAGCLAQAFQGLQTSSVQDAEEDSSRSLSTDGHQFQGRTLPFHLGLDPQQLQRSSSDPYQIHWNKWGTGGGSHAGSPLVNGSPLPLRGSHNLLVSPAKKSAAAQALKQGLDGKRILVVDDNMVNRKVISKMLQRYGVEVEAVDGGAAALKLLQLQSKFDFVFMDVQMPGMDGFEATRQIRQLEVKESVQTKFPIIEQHNSASHEDHGNNSRGQRMTIVALTADIGGGTQERCIEAGMDAYMTKPIEEDQLCKALLPFMSMNSAYK